MIDQDFVEVAVDAPLARVLTYRLPPHLKQVTQLGSRVTVPLGKRKSRGVITGSCVTDLAENKIKSIETLTDEPPLDPKMLAWLKWLSQYYLHPVGQVFAMAYAPGDEIRKRKSKKSSPLEFAGGESGASAEALAPTPEQKVAIDAIVASSERGAFETFLLFGVTGSGKTEVYLQAIDHVLRTKKQVLVLVPEISLTPQLIKRFVTRFGDNVAVLHSHLTERERSDQWWQMVRGKKQILVGARSALFCPVENLGLIVVDEEHEPSYKQEEQLKYHARDAAVMRGLMAKCPVVLGSATPSLESWQNAQLGKYKLLGLSARVENRPLPQVEVIDLRVEKDERDEFLPHWLSRTLHQKLKTTLEAEEQSALFLNRRGFAQFLLCSKCGYTEQCPNCSVSLTYHFKGQQLLCHYCGYEKVAKEKCPACPEGHLSQLGLGTERICEDLKQLFPKARVARADRDEIKTREDLEALLTSVHNHEVDIIVGTQMIAKGHDFPNLTLVGVVAADQGLHFPDFRSSERTFQLLTQVAGRAGRHKKSGQVIIQTYMPEHPAIKWATQQDFKNFALEELAERKDLFYPPFGKLAIVRIQGAKLEVVEQTSEDLAARIEKLKTLKDEYKNIEMLGPCESALAKLRNKFRFHLLLKEKSLKSLNSFMQHLMSNTDWIPSTVKITFDVDPNHFL